MPDQNNFDRKRYESASKFSFTQLLLYFIKIQCADNCIPYVNICKNKEYTYINIYSLYNIRDIKMSRSTIA